MLGWKSFQKTAIPSQQCDFTTDVSKDVSMAVSV